MNKNISIEYITAHHIFSHAKTTQNDLKYEFNFKNKRADIHTINKD